MSETDDMMRVDAVIWLGNGIKINIQTKRIRFPFVIPVLGAPHTQIDILTSITSSYPGTRSSAQEVP